MTVAQDTWEAEGHAAWHCLALLSFLVRGLGTDDRPPKGHQS